jgi:DNA modification methylase
MLDLGPDFDVDLLGIKDFVIEPIEKFEAQSDEDEVPDVVHPITRKGDIWILGNHRLMCGDSTMIDDVEKLMNGEKADITFTSPPYNVGKTPNGNSQKYLNDSDNKESKDFREFLNEFTLNSLMVSDYVFSNIQSLSGNKVALIEHLYDMREKFADTIIWDKKTAEPAMARKVLNSRFEYVHIFSNEAKRTIGKKDFRVTISNIFELNSRKGKEFAKIHKATFPVEFPEFFIENFTESSCMDPFNGTGTTMIACEKQNRKYFGMEKEPLYCDVSIQRWEKFTGKKAKLNGSDMTYEELRSQRGEVQDQ